MPMIVRLKPLLLCLFSDDVFTRCSADVQFNRSRLVSDLLRCPRPSSHSISSLLNCRVLISAQVREEEQWHTVADWLEQVCHDSRLVRSNGSWLDCLPDLLLRLGPINALCLTRLEHRM